MTYNLEILIKINLMQKYKYKLIYVFYIQKITIKVDHFYEI